MVAWPDLGTRVSVRYRRPTGSVPPLSDAVGHLLSVTPTVRVQTKSGAIVTFAPADAVALRTLTDIPVRAADIRSLENDAAAAWPADEQEWLDGWLLRAGATLATNSAVPLDISANTGTIPAIVDWYRQRGRPPRLVIPDRLLPMPPTLPTEHTEQVLACELSAGSAPEGTRWLGTRGYLVVDENRPDDIERARGLGFRLHHRRRYVRPPENSS